MVKTKAFLDGADLSSGVSPLGGEAHAAATLGVSAEYVHMHERAAAWIAQVNKALQLEALPLRLTCVGSVWSIRFEQAGRYHWLYQYLLRDEGAHLTWLSPGRLAFPHECTSAELDELEGALLRAAQRMRVEGWWPQPTEVALNTDVRIKMQVGKEAFAAVCGRGLVAVLHLLPNSVQAKINART